MVRKVIHLNCATLNPLFGKIICHCLLLDTDQGLVLVDTGLGKKDIELPKLRLDFLFRKFANPILDANETAYYQVQQIGYKVEDVKFIILTHLHPDHIGGIDDFPNATLITSKTEYDNAFNSRKARLAYNLKQISGNYKWLKIEFDKMQWNNFDAAEIFKDNADIRLIDLKGHTNGHCGVVINYSEKILFHCGDAYFDRNSIKHGTKRTSVPFKFFQSIVTANKKDRVNTEWKIRNLYSTSNNEIDFFCSHDKSEFEIMKSKL